MDDLEQHGKGNAARFSWMYEALPVVAAAFLLLAAQPCMLGQFPTYTLPNAPSALLFSASVFADANTLLAEGQDVPQNATQYAPPLPSPLAAPASPVEPLPGQSTQAPSGRAIHAYTPLPPCPKHRSREILPIIFEPATQPTCQDQLQLIVDTGYVKPLNSTQKGVLAIRAVIDPFNLLTIAAFSGISVAANAHSVYGPGFAGWSRLSAYSLAEDSQIEFTGVYLIPSLVHEDPRYHRMPGAPIARRIKHALIHTVVSQHDDGALMPNYATLINYPLSAEISNHYVPGIGTSGVDTAKRVLVGYGTDPIGPLIAEFLPDVAKRVHIHIVFAQQILNHIALGSGAQPSSF